MAIHTRSTRLIRQWRELALFYILAFGLSWLVWGSALAQEWGLIDWRLPDPLAYLGVTLAAIATALVFGGGAGVRDLLSRLGRWRVRPWWYAIAVALPIGVQLLAVVVYRALGGEVELGRITSLEGALSYVVIAIPFMLLTEELGWRGFAQPRLQARQPVLAAALIVGALWGMWHTPLFLTPGDPRSTYPYLGFVLSTMAQSVMTVWIFNNADESVLLAAIFHAVTNGAGGYIGMGVGDVAAFWVYVTVQCLVATAIVILTGPNWRQNRPEGALRHDGPRLSDRSS